MRLNKFTGLFMAAVLAVTTLNFVPAKKASADNPVVQTYFTADPSPLVVGDTLYLITSHDEDVLEKNKPTDDYLFFTMKNWKCYSTKDMVNWTDHGTIFGQSSFEWGHTWCFRAWAAQAVERDGKYYLYVPILRKGATEEADSPGYGIGVAVADNPYGPYEDAIGKPLIEGDWNDIDPTVYIDDDGQAYLFYGQTLKYVLLNDDMISLKTQPKKFSVPNYVEGPWFTKHDGTYYFMWAGHGGNTNAHKGGETLHYAYCDEPLGDYTYGGLLQETTKGVINEDGSINGSFTNHPGVCDFQGHSYLFYHTTELPGGCGDGAGAHRSVCVAEFTYNDDKSIDVVGMPDSVDPIGTLNPYNRVEAETICWSEGLKTGSTVNSQGYNDVYVYNMHDGDYINVREVDFGSNGTDVFKASIKDAKEDAAAQIEVYVDDELLAALNASNTSDEWKEISVRLNKKVTGIHDVKFVFRGSYDKPSNETGLSSDKNAYIHEEDTGMFKFDYWAFEEEKKAEPVPVQPSQPSNPPVSVSSSAPVVTETPAPAKPAKVKKLVVKKKGNKALVSWKKVKGAEKYQVAYSTDKKLKKGVKKITVKAAKCTVKKLKSKKTYYFKVRAYAGEEYGSYSAKKKIKM